MAETDTPPQANGHIFTFYSYKGGVGRSMALANIAEYFFMKGLRVLMVDWDLEAPGLEAFFFPRTDVSTLDEPAAPGTPPQTPIERMRSRLGLIDLLHEYKENYDVFAEGDVESYRRLLTDSISPQQYLQAIHRNDDGSSLSLMTAGWRGGKRFSAYAEAVQSFDWTGFYDNHRGRDFFDWLAGELKKLADVVLIDSRTGVTEMGGVCARHLADVVVSLCAPNSQNVEGIQRMFRSFNNEKVKEARQGRRLDALVVPTRIENAETERLTLFLKRFGEDLDTPEFRPEAFNDAKTKFQNLVIPYVTTYAFEEDRVFGPDVTGADPLHRLEEAYSKLAVHLALLTPDGHPVRRRMAVEIRRSFPDLLPSVVVSCIGAAGEEAAAAVRRELSMARVSSWPDLDHHNISESEAETCIRLSRFLVVIATLEVLQAGSPIEREVRLARQIGKHVFAVIPAPLDLPLWLQNAPSFGADEASLAKLIAAIRTPPPIVFAPNTAPAVPDKLVGREEELAQLRSRLMDAAQAKLVSNVIVVGAAGYGKSALAAAACHDDAVEAAFPGGILWLAAAGARDVADIAPRMLEMLGEPSSENEPTHTLRRRLEAANALVVLDNCEDALLVRSVALVLTRGALLVTTRRVDVAVATGGPLISLGPISTPAAESLVGFPLRLSAATSLNEEQRAVAAAIERWPAGLLLLRDLLQQRLARGERADTAWASIVTSFERHGISALDQASAASGGPALRSSVEQVFRSLAADPGAERRLARIAGHFRLNSFNVDQACILLFGESDARSHTARDSVTALLHALQDLSLLQSEPPGSFSIHPLILAYLVAEGRITAVSETARNRRFSSSRDEENNELVIRAKQVLRGRGGRFDELQVLAKSLKAARYFGYARRLLLRARGYPEAARLDAAGRVKLAQELAVCTYKDAELVSEQRFARALEFLHEADDLSTSRTQETLGKAGAIYKYRWMLDGNREHLERSLSFYVRGYHAGIINDDGYTAINAAFILDVLAAQEEDAALRQPGSPKTVEMPATVLQRRKEARTMRLEIMATLTDKLNKNEKAANWWLLVTLAEACFGLGLTPEGTVDGARYSEALRWFREALAQKNDDWEYETTARQLAAIATMQQQQRLRAGGDPAEEPEWQALRVFVGNHAPALKSLAIGKVGLALSGGGFRASLFHIGVLAKLAETDILRHVEVLSCVSGGSIIGAYYYLELKKLLEKKADSEITRLDYVELVKHVQQEFLAGVQENVRTRVATNPFSSLRMFFSPYYNRTNRIASLYEKKIFSRAGDGPHYLNDLFIVPPGEEAKTFSPKLDNWWRSSKVPELILNATTVNTGHNWQFTASWMGEPAASISDEIDGNDRLRRMYYWEAPARYREVRLGTAVAASSCVPGVFEPMALPWLYPHRVVRLVDGGVHDNQGLSALIENECKVLIVSDASGQMSNQQRPGTGLLSVTVRANDMLMARVREAQFRELVTRRDTKAIHEFLFVHLKKDLQTEPVDWIDCPDPVDATEEARPAEKRGPLTSYGILKPVQEQLAAIRTDLDSFSEIEAYALMNSGYRMIEEQLRKSEKFQGVDPDQRDSWSFLEIEPYLTTGRGDEDTSERVSRNLRIARSSGLKIFRIPEKLALTVFNTLGIAAIFVFGILPPYFAAGISPLYDIAVLLLIWPLSLALTLLLYGPMLALPVVALYRLAGVRKSLVQTTLAIFFFALFPVAWMHILIFDHWYLSWGRLRNYRRRRG